MKNKFKLDMYYQSIEFRDKYEIGLEKYYPRIILRASLRNEDKKPSKIPRFVSLNTLTLSLNSIYDDKYYMELKFVLNKNDSTDLTLPSVVSLNNTYLKINLNLFETFDINFDKCFANTRFDKSVQTIGLDVSISIESYHTEYQITTPEVEGFKFSEIRESIFKYLQNKENNYIGTIEVEDIEE